MKSFFELIFAGIGVLIALLLPAVIFQYSIHRLFEIKPDFIGLYCLLFACLAIKTIYFDKD
jgi:hypothetical protein